VSRKAIAEEEEKTNMQLRKKAAEGKAGMRKAKGRKDTGARK